MKSIVSIRFGAAAGVLAWLMFSATAHAQASDGQAGGSTAVPVPESAAESESQSIQDIVVTAQFRSQRLQDTPIAITAVTADTLTARGQTSVADIGSFSPNVNLSPQNAANNNGIAAFIRGVGQSSSSFAFEPGVGIYVDDVYYGTTFGANLDLTDLDRVEVLRGPQGTLAGKNSVGGAVKLFSKRPTADAGGFVEATYGRFNRRELRASANFGITSDLFARVSGVLKKTDGFFKNLDFGCANPGQGIAASPNNGGGCVIGREGGIDQTALRFALRYAPAGSPLEVNLSADFSDDSSQPVAAKLVSADNPNVRSYVPGDPLGGVPFDSRFITGPKSYSSYATYGNGGNYTTVFGVPTQVVPGSFNPGRQNSARNYGFSANVSYDLSDDLNLVSITAFRKADGTSVFDPDGSPLTILINNNGVRHKQFTQELRLSGKVGNLVDYTVGGFYYDADDDIVQRIQIPQIFYDFLTNDPISNNSKSLFAHVEVHAAEGLNLIGGLRYTKDRKTYTYSRRNPDGSLPSGAFGTLNFLVAGLDGLSGTFSDETVDYRIGANYRFSPSLMVYGQVSTGFKGGGVNPTPFTAIQVVPFGSEKLTAYEIGFKSDLLDRMLRINGSVFHNDYKDLQQNLFTCPQFPNPADQQCSLPANVGDARVQGAELEVTLEPVPGLAINGAMGYLDFQYKDNLNTATTGIARDMKAPFNNKWQASGGIEYAADLGESGTVTPRFDVAYQSSFFYNPVNNALNRIPGRTIANARLAYASADDVWGVSAQVANLFDKYYYTGAAENLTFGVSTYSLGRPREWSLTVRRRF